MGRSRTRALGRAVAVAAMVLAALPGVGHTQSRSSPDTPSSTAEIRLSFAPLVKRAAPAVVNVFTKKTVHQAPSPLFNDPFFRRFFGDDFPGAKGPDSVQNALGSGVIVDADGVIV